MTGMREDLERKLHHKQPRAAVCSCGNREVHGTTRCQAVAASRDVVTTKATETGIPVVTALDAWAHLRTPHDDGIDAAHDFLTIVDLGWRPVVGSTPERLWTKETPDA